MHAGNRRTEQCSAPHGEGERGEPPRPEQPPGAGRGGGGGTATWRGAEPGAQLVASLCAPPAPQTRSPPPPARRGAQRLGWVQCVGAGVAQGGSSAKPGSLGIRGLTPSTRCCREPPGGLMARPLRPQRRAGGAPHPPGWALPWLLPQELRGLSPAGASLTLAKTKEVHTNVAKENLNPLATPKPPGWAWVTAGHRESAA